MKGTAMAPRNFWKGYLKLSLVTCPVQMMPVTTEGEKVKFHTLNRKTHNRIATIYVDATSGKPVEEEEQIKGYEKGPDDYVMLEDDELEAVALESTRTIDVDTFAPADSIEWIYYDKPHYLVPDGKVGEEAFAVIREAMAATKTVGISRLVMYRRERAVMLQPRGKGIILWTLRYGDEVRDPKQYFKDVDEVEPEKKLVTLVHQLIDKKSKPWSPNMVEDPIQDKLLELIKIKKKGKKYHAPAKDDATSEVGSNVINIMDALKKSISAGRKKA
jgi:DNA end-binding protein Ku